MLTITHLRARSWKCFDELDLELGPTNYAIVARRIDDADASNWAGKSSLLELVDFVLYGRLAKAVRGKSGWITEGAKSGECELVLSDGTRIVRSKGLRGSEKVWCFPGDRSPEQGAVGDEAERMIGGLVGLTREDFTATCYFQQRQMARLVLCEPSERLDLVAGWIRLGPLQDCEALAVGALAALTQERDELRITERNIAAASVVVCEALETGRQTWLPTHTLDSVEALTAAEQGMGAIVANLERQVELAREAHVEAVKRREREAQGRRYEAVIGEGKRLAAERSVLPKADEFERTVFGPLREKVRSIGEELAIAERDAKALRGAASGRFDGVCPIVGQICPAREFVLTTANRDRVAGSEKDRKVVELRAAYEEASKQLAGWTEQSRAADRLDIRLADLREEARRLKVAHEHWQAGKNIEDPDEQERARLESELVDASVYLSAISKARHTVEQNRLQAEELRRRLAGLEAAIDAAREGAAIFGPNGAQRRAAEGALSEIETDANQALERCAIDLSVRMVWSRDGSGLAAACTDCGAAYPASRKVMTCTRCGAARGPNQINKLEVEVSDRSGGADDLAGGVVQLAASRWLRDDRASQWGAALIDEPFGQMDLANQRAFANRLPALLRDAGFAQSFVIAHHRNVLDAMPGRIEVVSDGRRSTARVV